MTTKFKTLVEHGPKPVDDFQLTDVLDRLDLPATLNCRNFDQLVLGRVKDPKTGAEQILVKAREWRYISQDELKKATEAGVAPSVYGVVEVPDEKQEEQGANGEQRQTAEDKPPRRLKSVPPPEDDPLYPLGP